MYGMNSIGAMPGMNSLLGMSMPDYASMNNVRLMLQMQKTSGADKSQSYRKFVGLDTESADFLKEYQGDMTDLLDKANALREGNPAGVMGRLAAASSDDEVLTAEARYRITEPANYEVEVAQVAAAQKNVSAAFDSAGNDALSGSLRIETAAGRYTTVDLGRIAGRNNREKLENLAEEINGRGAGVEARVVNQDGGSRLEIASSETGERNAFAVSGGFAERTGLSGVSQRGQDARYTVSDGNGTASFTSASNEVRIGGYKLSATLKKQGSAAISVGADTGRIASGLEDLVKSYNKAVDFLSDNLDERGVGVAQQLRRMLTPVAEKTMERIGLSRNADGTLAFNKTAFKEAAEKSPSLVNDIVGGQFGVAGRLYDAAKSGMAISSTRLTGQNPGGSRYSGSSYQQMQASRLFDPLNMMSTYNRQGISSVLNYNSVGLLMNINI